MLQRMAELYVQGANEVLTTTDVAKIDSEVKQLSEQIDAIAKQTQFNTKKLLDGTVTNVVFQVGANSGETISLGLTVALATALSVQFGGTGLTALSASTALNTDAANLSVVQVAINKVSEIRSNLGAVQNRLEHTINNLGTTSENLQVAESRIRDVDMAKKCLNSRRTIFFNKSQQQCWLKLTNNLKVCSNCFVKIYTEPAGKPAGFLLYKFLM